MSARRGFTLLELMLAIAVIALLATVLIGASASLLKERTMTPDEVFWKASQSARRLAVATGHDVRLTFDDRAKAFNVSDGETAKTLPLTGDTSALGVDFLSTQVAATSILIGGNLESTQTQPFVTYFGDGTCSPFRLQIRTKTGAHQLGIDPWTCAPILPARDATGALVNPPS